ncbi:4-phosphoerythronate dehydrogenase [Bacteroidetes/Chlorobi group bacterium ChocPot_Mid]|nr:MAG: 4-phosphoerythronate dehydrogenase [Bacteroidetes/Chlorobi group bacterium ChocPot_Mid]
MSKNYKILIDENIPYLAEILKSYGSIELFTGRNLTNQHLVKSGCQILFIRSTTKVNRELLNNTKVKFVGTATSGTDHIDIDYLKDSKIYFANANGSNSNSVAELVIFSILKWLKISPKNISDLTIGIIGFGNIGKLVAKYSTYLGLNILVNDPPLFEENFQFPANINYIDLPTLIRNSDIITNHVPLTKSTKYPTYQMFNKEIFNFMKEGALFIHTSRGKVVNEKHFLDVLANKKIYSVFDVWEDEPLINKELASKCILATPHIGGYSKDGKLKGVNMMIDAFQSYTGESVDNIIIQSELDSYKPLQAVKFKDIDLIYNLLKDNRKFDEDHQALMQTLTLPDGKRAKTFDLLRKNYPPRREVL